jgi:hypothetical protein
MHKPKQLSISDLQGLIIKALPKGYPNIKYVADGVGIPVRTLQRRLHHAGYSYTELVDQAR